MGTQNCLWLDDDWNVRVRRQTGVLRMSWGESMHEGTHTDSCVTVAAYKGMEDLYHGKPY